MSSFAITLNPPPTLELIPADTVHHLIEMDGLSAINIRYSISDTLTDNRFNLILYWTSDTAGLASDPTIFDSLDYVGRTLNLPRGAGLYAWQAGQPTVENSGYTAAVDTGVTFRFVGVVTDGYPGNRDIQVSANEYMWRYPNSAPGIEELPRQFGLTGAFPNPFNDAISIDYALPTASNITLNIFDLAGRRIADLQKGLMSAGRHTVSWQPQDVPAGVYLARLESPSQTALRKVVYMP